MEYNMMKCDFCKQKFKFGPHAYELKALPRYRLSICKGCRAANHDGIAPHLEKEVLAHLKAQGLPEPARNEKGWLPLE